MARIEFSAGRKLKRKKTRQNSIFLYAKPKTVSFYQGWP